MRTRSRQSTGREDGFADLLTVTNDGLTVEWDRQKHRYRHGLACSFIPGFCLKLFRASGVLDPAAFEEFRAAADLNRAIELQEGRLADMDCIALAITTG